jgi:hypothetical protein
MGGYEVLVVVGFICVGSAVVSWVIWDVRHVQEFEVSCFKLVNAFFQFKIFLRKFGLFVNLSLSGWWMYLIFDSSESFVQELTCPLSHVSAPNQG